MQLSKVLLLSTFASLAASAALPSPEPAALSSSEPGFTPIEKRGFWAGTGNEDKCGHATFINKSSGGSPLVRDCQCLLDYFQNTKRGYYTTDLTQYPGGYDRMAWCGTCVFGVRSKNILGGPVGNLDARDLIRDSIRMFQWNGRVGAEGEMGCGSNPVRKVYWAVFHT